MLLSCCRFDRRWSSTSVDLCVCWYVNWGINRSLKTFTLGAFSQLLRWGSKRAEPVLNMWCHRALPSDWSVQTECAKHTLLSVHEVQAVVFFVWLELKVKAGRSKPQNGAGFSVGDHILLWLLAHSVCYKNIFNNFTISSMLHLVYVFM